MSDDIKDTCLDQEIDDETAEIMEQVQVQLATSIAGLVSELHEACQEVLPDADEAVPHTMLISGFVRATGQIIAAFPEGDHQSLLTFAVQEMLDQLHNQTIPKDSPHYHPDFGHA